ncbi:hypothetical protein PTKIN_Ptkin14bG0016700 [Pterospermum kingtungense]
MHRVWNFTELQLPYLITLFLSFFLFTVVRILKRTKANKSTLKLPPGPWKLPLLGNMHQLLSSLPHRTLRDFANKYGTLMHLQLGEVPTIIVSSAKVAQEVMKNNDIIFSQRAYNLVMDIMTYNFKAIIFTPYGNYWREIRKICTMELLSPSRVQLFQSIREEEVSDFIESIALNEGSPINLSKKIFSLSYGITARAAFGKKAEGQEEFIRIMAKTMDLAGGFRLANIYPSSHVLRRFSRLTIEVKKLHEASDRILENVVNEHRESRNRMKEAGNVLVEERLKDQNSP